MLKTLICKYFGHKVDRHRVWHDGIDFRTACARCAAPLLRGQKGWRAFDPERDSDFERTVHPAATPSPTRG